MTDETQPQIKPRKHKTEAIADKFVAWVRSHPAFSRFKEFAISEESCKRRGFKYSIYFYDFYVKEGKKPDLPSLMEESKFRVTVLDNGRARITTPQATYVPNNIRDLIMEIYEEHDENDVEMITEAFPRMIKKQTQKKVRRVFGDEPVSDVERYNDPTL